MAYSKQTWDTTSYVNPTRMNHIEQGIYDDSQIVESLNNNSLSAFGVLGDRVQIQSGGYYVKGKMVFINVKIKALTTATNIPAILSTNASHVPNSEFSLLANDTSNGIANVGENIPCGIETRGYIFISKIETNKIYQITGWYMKA